MTARHLRWPLALMTSLAGLVLVWLVAGDLPLVPAGPYRDPYWARIGIIASLLGAVWYVAECFSLFWMRFAAAMAATTVALALIAVGDQARTTSEAMSYLPLRESVGSELATIIEIDGGTSSDRGNEEAEGTGGEAAAGAETEASPEAAAEAISEAVVRLNQSGHEADSRVIACDAVSTRALSSGLPPLVTLDRIASEATPEPVADNVISVARLGRTLPERPATGDDEGDQSAGEEQLEGRELTSDERGRVDALLDLLTATDLTDVLSGGEGPFLIFLPPRAHIAAAAVGDPSADLSKLEPGQLAQDRTLVELMQLHAVQREPRPGTAFTDLSDTTTLVTLSGDRLNIERNDQDGFVIRTRSGVPIAANAEPLVRGANGAIYPIEQLIDPPDDLLRMLAIDRAGRFDRFVEALNVTGLAETVGGQGELTVFAPTGLAFETYWKAEGITEKAFFESPLLGDFVARHIIPGRVAASDISPGDPFELESLWLAPVDLTVKSSGGAVAVTVDNHEATSVLEDADFGELYAVDTVLTRPDASTCHPRDASLSLLNTLRVELIAAAARTTDASVQEQLAARLDQVEGQIEILATEVAVQRLIIDGADTLVGDFLDPVLRDDIAARVGGWGWLIVAIGLIIAYRWLEVANGRRHPGPVVVTSGASGSDSEPSQQNAALAANIVKNVLGQAELREPSEIPGSEASKQVAELMQDDGIAGSKAAEIALGLIRSTAFPRKGMVVTMTTECEQEGKAEPGNVFIVTARVTDARTQRLLFTHPFQAKSIRSAATEAAHFVAAKALSRGVTTAPWARWPDDDGTGLGAYQQVAIDDRRRRDEVAPSVRRESLERAVAACPHSGLARVALAQQYLVHGPDTVSDPRKDDQQPSSDEIGDALMAGLDHLIKATHLYPEFLLARYRLAASFSMLSESIPDYYWHHTMRTTEPELAPAETKALIAASLLAPNRHRREWRTRQPKLDPTFWHRFGSRVGSAAVMARSRLRDELPVRTVVKPRIETTDSDALRGRLDAEQADTPGANDAPSAGSAGVDENNESVVVTPSAELMLNLATREINSALADIRYAYFRVWRQAEREYWLDLVLKRRLRARYKASLRVLAEIVRLRGTQPGELGWAEIQRRIEVVDGIQAAHRDDAVTTYTAGCFYGVLVGRTRHCPSNDAPNYADKAIRLVHQARDAENGYLINHRWVRRDPDLRHLQDFDQEGWDRLLIRLKRLRTSINGST